MGISGTRSAARVSPPRGSPRHAVALATSMSPMTLLAATLLGTLSVTALVVFLALSSIE